MELKDIARRIEANIKGKSFCLCDETTTDTKDISALLNEAFQIISLQLENISYSFTDKILLEGTAGLEGQPGVKISTVFSQEKDQKLSCSISAVMPKDWLMPLDFEELFCLSEVTRNFKRFLDTGKITGNISGSLCLAQLVFQAAGEYNTEEHKWSVKFTLEGETSSRELLRILDSFAKLGIPVEILPDISFQKLIMEYEERGTDLWDKLLVDVTTGCALKITDQFGIEDLGIVLQKSNTSYSFTLKGNLRIGTTELPVFLRFRSGGFDLGVDTGTDGCLLPSLSDVAGLLGIADMVSFFPPELVSRKSLKLLLFTLSVPATLQSLNSFSVTIATTEEWSFFGIPGISVKDLYLGFQRQAVSEGQQIQLLLLGTIRISDFEVRLGGIYSTGDGWTLSGGFPPMEEVHLDQLFISLAKLLGLTTAVTLPLPQILLYGVQVEFGLTNKRFFAAAKTKITGKTPDTILDKLFQIEAEISIVSELKNNVRSYRGRFFGALEIEESRFTVEYLFDNSTKNNSVTVKWAPLHEGEAITLTGILSCFGVREIPQIITSLDVGISSVDMQYKIDEKELTITVSSGKFGSIRLTVSDKDYEADIKLKDKITLSMLPLVGTYLHLLDSLAVEQLELLASSKEQPQLHTLSGVALLGKIFGEPFVLQLYHQEEQRLIECRADNSADALTKWIPINKTLGIFEFYRFGIGFREGSIAFVLDASLAVKPIGISLMGLGIGFKLNSPGDISFYLSGMGIDFDNGTVAISGAFMKSTLGNAECYDGKLLLKAGDLSLFAIGSYSGDSLLVYALLNKNIGGPPIFFVTGIAAGFGYNMQVNVPSVDKVADFPLVSGAIGRIDKNNMLTKLKENISVRKGQTFLAAGVKFTSFRIIESFALLTVTFGNYTEINLLGLSELSVPPCLPKEVEPLAYAQLALKATFSPRDGLFSLIAKLTSESYILSKKCKLTGGFAFYVWFSGEHAGDFVLTLGGYHPNYIKPAHYPDVPRLGFHWDVTGELSLSGDLYFALTPSALMAGGRLSAVYSSGCVSAWFVAKADFYLAWKPFFYDVSLFIGFGVAVRVNLLFVRTTIKLELSAGLHIWGPQFSGTARISLYIISFTIKFGADSERPPDLKWTEFAESFLPQKEAGGGKLSANGQTEQNMPLSIAVTDGQRGEDSAAQATIPVVSPEKVEFLIKSAVPVTKIIVNNNPITLRPDMPAVGILPMGEGKTLQSELTVTLLHPTAETLTWECEPAYENLPTAVWGLRKTKEELLQGVATGIRIRPVVRETSAFPKKGYIDLDKLSVFSCIERKFDWNPVWQLPAHEQDNPIEEFARTVMSEAVSKARESLIKGFCEAGFDFNTKIDLGGMAKEADNIFAEEMVLGVMI